MSEHLSQKAFFDWAALSKIPGIDLMHAIPNGGARHIAVASKLKAEGVKAGALDVQWPVARGGYIGLAIEFKHGDGNPTKEQRERITRLQMEGWCVAVVWDWQAAARVVRGYSGMLHVGVA
jgi:hypothetical protein